MTATAAAECVLRQERRARPFGDRLPRQLAGLPPDVRGALLAEAQLALAALDVDDAAEAFYARIRSAAFGTLPLWPALPPEARPWSLRRSAAARGEPAPAPVRRPPSTPAAPTAAPAAATRLF